MGNHGNGRTNRMKCIRCGNSFDGSFTGECASCESHVILEWIATENCEEEIRKAEAKLPPPPNPSDSQSIADDILSRHGEKSA